MSVPEVPIAAAAGSSAGRRRPVRAAWDLLTTPHRDVVPPEARRRARTLAAVLLFLIVSAALLTWVVPWLVAPEEGAANHTLAYTGLVAVGLGLGIYVLARTRWFETAARLTVVGTMVSCALSIALADGTLWAEDAPYFLSLSVILSSILLPLSATFFVIGGNVAILAFLDRVLPGFHTVDLSNSVAFLAFVSILLLAAGRVRQLDLRQIHAQAEELAVSEERYRSLFEASFEGIALHDGGIIVDTNAALGEMIGVPRERLVGMPVDALVTADSGPHIVQKTIMSAHETSEAVAERADGTPFPVEFVSKPYIHGGRLVRVTAFRDISERKEAEAAREKSRELLAANHRLQEIDRLKTHILNTASHELNTPITPLRLQVHLLKEGRLGAMNQKQARAVDILHRNLGRLDHLVKDMLDVSHLESGRFRVDRARIDLVALVADAADSYGDVAIERGVTLTMDAEGPAWVSGDAERLLQVVHNLLSNALKFTPPEGEVRLGCRVDGDVARVAVADTGLGLTVEQRAGLFQPFGQVHPLMHRTERGSGLGLYISKGIVQHHGGHMEVASAGAGRGSTFAFVLPLEAEEAEAEAVPTSVATSMQSEPEKGA